MSFYCTDEDPSKCNCTVHRARRHHVEARTLPSMTVMCPGCGVHHTDAIAPPGAMFTAEMIGRAAVDFAARHAAHCTGEAQYRVECLR